MSVSTTVAPALEGMVGVANSEGVKPGWGDLDEFGHGSNCVDREPESRSDDEVCILPVLAVVEDIRSEVAVSDSLYSESMRSEVSLTNSASGSRMTTDAGDPGGLLVSTGWGM